MKTKAMTMRTLTTVTAALIFLLTPLAFANDWPQWRGPNRDDLSTETGLLTAWPSGGPPLVWKADGLGVGYSSVAVVGQRIYTMGDLGGASSLVALAAADGQVLWTAKVGKPGGGPAGTRSTPTVDNDLVFGLGQNGELVCVAAATGKEIWRKDLVKDFGGRHGGWLYAESPLVDGDKVICTPGGAQGAMVAFNKKTGAVLWQSKEFTDSAEYSSPIVETIGAVRQYIQFTGRSVAGVAADDGRLLWRASRPGRTATVPTPIFRDDLIYVTSGYNVGCNLFKVTATGGAFETEQVYANGNMVNHHGGVLRVGDYLYGHSDSKGWICQDFKSGKTVWSDRGVGKGSLTFADGHLYLRSEGGKGVVALVEATPDGYKETGRFDQPERSKENSWAHPVIANGKLYLRDQDVLLCYDVKAK